MTRRIYRLLLAALIAYWLTIFTLTHLPARDLPHIQVSDKIEHLAAFGVLSILLNLVLGTRLTTNRDWLTVAIVLAYGAIDEWLQTPVGRDCDLHDWFADGTGAALGVALCGLYRYLRLRANIRRQPALQESLHATSSAREER